MSFQQLVSRFVDGKQHFEVMRLLEYIQEFIFSRSRVFHIATASVHAVRTHIRASVDRNMLQ